MDIVAARQLFTFHLPDMCVKGSASAALFNAMSEASRACGGLLSVLGYFPRQEARACACLPCPCCSWVIPHVLWALASCKPTAHRRLRQNAHRMHVLPFVEKENLRVMQVVAMCSRHHTEISLVADYSSSLSFWCVNCHKGMVLPFDSRVILQAWHAGGQRGNIVQHSSAVAEGG